jgi:hypothetical protein
VALPINGNLPRFLFIRPRLTVDPSTFPCKQGGLLPGWEVVQLVGLQTLDLAILVRVQASQPNFRREHRANCERKGILKRIHLQTAARIG